MRMKKGGRAENFIIGVVCLVAFFGLAKISIWLAVLPGSLLFWVAIQALLYVMIGPTKNEIYAEFLLWCEAWAEALVSLEKNILAKYGSFSSKVVEEMIEVIPEIFPWSQSQKTIFNTQKAKIKNLYSLGEAIAETEWLYKLKYHSSDIWGKEGAKVHAYSACI